MPPTTEQTELVASLTRKKQQLAGIYEAGLHVFYQKENAGRLPLAAHSMRERIEKWPTLTGREPRVQGDSMKSRIHPVRQAHDALKEKGFTDTSPLEAMGKAVRQVLTRLSTFFDWMDDNRPRLEKETAEMLSDLSGPGIPVPMDISDATVAGWMAADGYFKRVAHHGEEHVNEDEFVGHMTFVEKVLLQRLQPRAIADLDAIDALVAEAEHGE